MSEDSHNPVDAHVEDRPRPLLEHLEELRKCIMRCLVAWGICVLAVGLFCPRILAWLQSPLTAAGQDAHKLVTVLTIEGGIGFVFKAMLWGGTVLSLPLLLALIARFVFPGLRPVERRWVTGVLVTAGVFFVAGVVTCYRYVVALGLQALIEVDKWLGVQVGPVSLDSYSKIVFQMVLAFGVAFELPLLLVILGWIGLVSAKFLREKRRHAIVINFVIAMVLTPPDAVSMIIMAVPLCVVYEICILLIRARELARGRPAQSP